MPPNAIQLAFFVIQEAIQLEPKIAQAIRNLFTKADPTADDWAKLRASVAGETYFQFVPASDLSSTGSTAPAEPAQGGASQTPAEPAQPAGDGSKTPEL